MTWRYLAPSCGYVVVNRDGVPLRSTFSRTHSAAKRDFLNGKFPDSTDWEFWRKRGYTIRRAVIQLV
jgi:hypothetical protein